ncbi:hypothetical protein [Aureimonas sp. AU12]|uniref:hypothetical protein n=1 Tax=Aureimonas sp. AU12 TaxID=1638161 RepID=UPI0007806FDF|nr:hypothetical protein [Aureimonas sp. AU12]
MRNLLDRILRAPDGAGGGAPPAAAASAPPAAAAPAAPAAGAPAAGEPPAAPPAGGPAAPPAGSAPYRPDGLAEQFHGESDQQTIDKLFQAMNARGEVPADVAAYKDYGDVDEALKPYYATLEQDGLFDAIANKARDLGVSKAQMQGLLSAYMGGAAEMGLLEPVIDVAAERTALLPDAAKSLPKAEQDRAIDKRMNDNLGWVEQMVQRGLPADAAKHMTMMLGDTADGHKAIEFFRSQMTGAGDPRPVGAGQAAPGGTAAADLQKRATMPENTPGNAKFDKVSYDKLQADYIAAYPGD